jgi:hypothetical protein
VREGGRGGNDGEVEWGVTGGDERRMGTNARERWTEGRGVEGGRSERGADHAGGEEDRRVGRRGEEIARVGPGRGGVCNAGFASRSSEGQLREHLQDGARRHR